MKKVGARCFQPGFCLIDYPLLLGIAVPVVVDCVPVVNCIAAVIKISVIDIIVILILLRPLLTPLRPVSPYTPQRLPARLVTMRSIAEASVF